jgi:protein-tyrosine phosphatase/ADP-ribosylglycohydrolase
MNTDELASASPPIPNSYWVRPGRLLAGEYPGSMSRAEAMERVEKLLRAGVTSFIDLTEDGELPEYENLLPGLTEQQVRYRRLPIVDHSLPDSPAHMSRILDLIDSELAAGRCVYVHCHAGIGRTGMTMGCHLIRSGLANEGALERLQQLWRQCARSRRWPSVPETDEQVEFVRLWREGAASGGAVRIDMTARYEGAFVGLAIGDALGTLVATSNFDAATLVAGVRDSGVLIPGANTAMTRAVAESLLALSAHDPKDQMQRYLEWNRGAGSIAVPGELKRALAAWQWSKKKNAGSHDPKNLDPHSLPRTLAVALFMQADPQGAVDMAAEVSRTTQQSPMVLDLCRTWVALLVDALSGVDKGTLVACNGPSMQWVRKRTLKAPVKNFLDGRTRGEPESASDALSVTNVAMAGFASTPTFRDALIHIETSTRAAPAAGALCGALAGAYYGIDSIPPEWRRQLAEDAALRSLARHLQS